MSVDWVIAPIDTLAFAAFVTAFVVLCMAPSSTDGWLSSTAKLCMMVAMGVYVFAMFSNVLEHVGYPALDATEDYIELLFPPFVFYSAYTLFVRQRENELVAAERSARRSREMMLEIIDTAPAGILVISADGRIAFANETARDVLDLVEDSDSFSLTHGDWEIVDLSRGAEAAAVKDFGALVHGRARRDVPVRVSWPSGWARELRVSIAPLADERDELGGAVVGFIDVA